MNTTRRQSVAEHSWAVAVIADELIDRAFGDTTMTRTLSVFRKNVRELAVYHDIAEAVIGDIPTPTKKRLNGAVKKLEQELVGDKKYSDLVVQTVKLADMIEALVFVTTHGVGRHAAIVAHDMQARINLKLKPLPSTISTAVEGIIEDLLRGDVML